MRQLKAHQALAGLAASLLIGPAMAQDDTATEPPFQIVTVESQPRTPEQQRADEAAEAEFRKAVQERGVFGVYLTGLDAPSRAIA